MKSQFKLWISLCILCVVPALASADIVIDSYSAQTNDRFTNNPNFIAASFDLSGVGQSFDNQPGTDIDGRWATAISANVIISANHFPPIGDIFFYPNNDPNSTPVVRRVVSGQQIGSTDLYIGKLNDALPSSITHYNFLSLSLTGPLPNGQNFFVTDAGPLQGLNAYLFGRSPFDETILNDNRFPYNDQAVGRNRISGYSENVPFTGSDNDSLIFNYDNAAGANYVQYEAAFRSGDSGAPAFIDVNGQLVLLGTNSFVFSDLSASGINYIGNQATFIQNFIQINAVPEPSSLALVLVAAASLLNRRKRRDGRS